MVLVSCDVFPGNVEEEKILRIGSSKERKEWHHTTQLYQAFQPGIEFEFVTGMNPPFGKETVGNSMEGLMNLMTESNPPDIIILNFDEFIELQKNNLLAPLDRFFSGNGSINEEVFIPLMIDSLRSESDHSIYGLAPELRSHALIYNKQMFDKAGVDPPRDQMTWDELFALAQAVTVQDEEHPIYGFSFGPRNFGSVSFRELDRWYAPVTELDLLEEGKLNPPWADMFTSMYGYERSGMFPSMEGLQKEINGVKGDPFLSGRLAMMIADYKEAHRLMNVNRNAAHIEGYDPVDWEAVMLPVRDETSGTAANISFNAVFAIHANANNPELAWEFISFVHGEEWASLHAGEDRLLTRLDYPKKVEPDFREEAFYSFQGVGGSDRFYDQRQKPEDLEDVRSAWDRAMSRALDGLIPL